MFTKQSVRTYVHAYKPAKKVKAKKATDLFETAALSPGEISGVELRLSRAHILNNRTAGFGPFPGYAKIYFLTLVVSDVKNQAVFVDIKAFPKVDSKEDLPIDNTLYYWKKNSGNAIPPSQLHVFTSIIKSKQSLRDTGKILQDLKNDAGYKSAIETVISVITSASPVTPVVAQITNLANILGKFLGKVDDKPLISVLQSYTDINGDFDVLGKVSREYKSRYAILGLSLTIRDKAREKMANQ